MYAMHWDKSTKWHRQVVSQIYCERLTAPLRKACHKDAVRMLFLERESPNLHFDHPQEVLSHFSRLALVPNSGRIRNILPSELRNTWNSNKIKPR